MEDKSVAPSSSASLRDEPFDIIVQVRHSHKLYNFGSGCSCDKLATSSEWRGFLAWSVHLKKVLNISARDKLLLVKETRNSRVQPTPRIVMYCILFISPPVSVQYTATKDNNMDGLQIHF